MAETRALSIPVILGTSRKGRLSAHAARFVWQELQKREGVCSELIDIADLNHTLGDNGEGTGGVLEETPACPQCGNVESRRV